MATSKKAADGRQAEVVVPSVRSSQQRQQSKLTAQNQMALALACPFIDAIFQHVDQVQLARHMPYRFRVPGSRVSTRATPDTTINVVWI